MTLRTCTVSCEDSDGHEHSLEVTAETLYEAVAQALAAFKSNAWVGQIGRGHTITVRVQQQAVERRVRASWILRSGSALTANHLQSVRKGVFMNSLQVLYELLASIG
jgi:hypothetical protein